MASLMVGAVAGSGGVAVSSGAGSGAASGGAVGWAPCPQAPFASAKAAVVAPAARVNLSPRMAYPPTKKNARRGGQPRADVGVRAIGPVSAPVASSAGAEPRRPALSR